MTAWVENRFRRPIRIQKFDHVEEEKEDGGCEAAKELTPAHVTPGILRHHQIQRHAGQLAQQDRNGVLGPFTSNFETTAASIS